MRSVNDLTTKARIRDAAIACIANRGVVGTSARRIATEAGVSPGLVMHHFGSMEGLRSACDEYVADAIRSRKEKALSDGASLDVLAVFREADMGPLAAYLAAVLVEDSPVVARLVDELVADAETYIQHGVESGVFISSDNPRGRAVTLAIWALGALVLHRHVERLVGVDLTDPDLGKEPSFAAYVAPIYEIYGNGIFTPEAAVHFTTAVAGIAAQEQHDESTKSEEAS